MYPHVLCLRQSRCSIKLVIVFLEIVAKASQAGISFQHFIRVKSLQLLFLQLGLSYVTVQVMPCTASRVVIDLEVSVNSAPWGCAVSNLHNSTWTLCLHPGS